MFYIIMKNILCMINIDGRSYEPCHITIQKTDIIDKFHFWKYNSQPLNLINDNICVGNDRFFYLNDDGKLELFYMQKKTFPAEKQNNYVIFIEWTELNWNGKYGNGLCVSIWRRAPLTTVIITWVILWDRWRLALEID